MKIKNKMRFKNKSIEIELYDPTAKGKIFSFQTNKIYNSPQEELKDIRKIKIKKIINRKDL